MRGRWRWAIASGIVLAALLLVTAWVRMTDVGAPSDYYATAPNPCKLLSEQTIQDIVGDPDRLDSQDRIKWSRNALHQQPDIRQCTIRGPEPEGASMIMYTYRFYSTQFYLGRTGAHRAAEHFTYAHGLTRDYYRHDCTFERTSESGNACAVPTAHGIELHIQHQNLYVDITINAPLPDPAPDELLASATDEVLQRLDAQAG